MTVLVRISIARTSVIECTDKMRHYNLVGKKLWARILFPDSVQ